MRNTACALVLGVLATACSGEGSDETTGSSTSITLPTTPMDTGTDPALTTTTSPTTSTSNPDTSTGPETTTTTTTDPTGTSTAPITSTDDTDSTTVPSTVSDTSSDTSSSSTTVDPSDTDTSTSTTTDGDSTTTTSGDSTTTTGEETTESMPCATVMATLSPIAPNIMLVLDKSGSMVQNSWDHDADGGTPPITRWASLHAVVTNILDNFDQIINFGAKLFPAKNATSNPNDTACTTSGTPDVTVGFNKGTNILNFMPPADATTAAIKGGTPASRGMTTALNHLNSLDPAIPRAVLFITDGAANCKPNTAYPALFETYDDTLLPIVQGAQAAGISTYVVGIDIANTNSGDNVDGNPDNINPYQKLNELAIAGGKPKNDPAEKFYQANNEIELSAALATIISDTISCEIELANEPAKPEFTEVEISGMEVPFVPSCNGMDGWTWTNPAGPYDGIILCGTACDQLKQVGEADVNFFCVPG